MTLSRLLIKISVITEIIQKTTTAIKAINVIKSNDDVRINKTNDE
jgi:hypothetical protein